MRIYIYDDYYYIYMIIVIIYIYIIWRSIYQEIQLLFFISFGHCWYYLVGLKCPSSGVLHFIRPLLDSSEANEAVSCCVFFLFRTGGYHQPFLWRKWTLQWWKTRWIFHDVHRILGKWHDHCENPLEHGPHGSLESHFSVVGPRVEVSALSTTLVLFQVHFWVVCRSYRMVW